MTTTAATINNPQSHSALADGWSIVRFDQMAVNITDRVDNPSEAGVERYVGLEHLDPEFLKIRRWGKPDDVEATKLLFQPGDIIFGKRRFYQRKLAVADFEGICSAHALVLRAREEAVVKEFLPFFMQSDTFFERAMSISVGSLSPTINWTALARQEFAIPPRDEQRRIAEILWAVDEVVELYLLAVTATETTFSVSLTNLMKNGLRTAAVTHSKQDELAYPEHWQIKPLIEVASVERGRFAHRPRNLSRFYGGNYPFVQTGDVARSKGVLQSYEQTLSEEGKNLSRSFPTGSILITIAAIIGKTAIAPFDIWCTDSVVGIQPKSNVDSHFLEFYLRTIQPYLEQKAATQTAQKNINLAVLRPLLIPIPPLDEQRVIVNLLGSLEQQIALQHKHIVLVRELGKALSRNLLGQA